VLAALAQDQAEISARWTCSRHCAPAYEVAAMTARDAARRKPR
jgi:hypothetical protein